MTFTCSSSHPWTSRSHRPESEENSYELDTETAGCQCLPHTLIVFFRRLHCDFFSLSFRCNKSSLHSSFSLTNFFFFSSLCLWLLLNQFCKVREESQARRIRRRTLPSLSPSWSSEVPPRLSRRSSLTATASPEDPRTTAFSLLQSSSALRLPPLNSTITARFSAPPEVRSVRLFPFWSFRSSTRGRRRSTTLGARDSITPRCSAGLGA